MGGAIPLKSIFKHRSSFWLNFLALCLLVLSLSGWLRGIGSIMRWGQLTQLGVQPGPFYLTVTGLLVGLLGLAGAIGIWTRSRWAPVYSNLVVFSWLTWLWIDRLLIAVSPTARSNWPFLAGASVLLLVGVFLILQRGRDRFR